MNVWYMKNRMVRTSKLKLTIAHCTRHYFIYNILFLNTMVLTEKKSTERYICCSRRPINDQQSQCYVRMPFSGGLYPQGKFMCYFYARRFPLRETHVTLYCNFIFNGLTKVIKSPEECTTFDQMTFWSRTMLLYGQ
jgi:hypothetical protein